MVALVDLVGECRDISHAVFLARQPALDIGGVVKLLLLEVRSAYLGTTKKRPKFGADVVRYRRNSHSCCSVRGHDSAAFVGRYGHRAGGGRMERHNAGPCPLQGKL